MSLDTERILDRRWLRRRVGFWRNAAIALGFVAAGAIAYTLTGGQGLADRKQIARVTIEGMITEDRDQLRLLKRLADAKNVEGVILVINSPGGTTTGGEALFDSIRTIAKSKPVVAQFGTVAASAAYITGLAADHIVARGNTITGSVGVIFQWPEVSGLLEKLGVKMNEIKSGPLKAVPSMYEPINPEGRRLTEQMVAESQKWFVGLVADRRGVKTADIPGLEQGRVFSGREALGFKLVDQLGGEAEVVRWLEDSRKITKDLKIVDWKPRREQDLSWTRLFGQAAARMIGLSDEAARVVPDAEQVMRRLTLDGLVSVWQPLEK
jgi:protease-4